MIIQVFTLVAILILSTIYLFFFSRIQIKFFNSFNTNRNLAINILYAGSLIGASINMVVVADISVDSIRYFLFNDNYLKAFYLESLETSFGRLIHPPIDRILLKGLIAEKKNKEFFDFEKFIDHRHLSGTPRLPAWTKLDKRDYLGIIAKIKEYLLDAKVKSLWQVESAWKGHQ